VTDGDVHLLDARRHRRRNDDERIAYIAHSSSRASRESYGLQSHGPGARQAPEDVLAVAGSRNTHGDIAPAAQSLDLPLEQAVEPQVIAASRQRRGVGGERDGGDGGAVRLVADDEFGGNVLSVGGTAAIAEQQEFAAAAQTGLYQFQGFHEGTAEHLRRCFEGSAMLAEFLSQQDLAIRQEHPAERLFAQHIQ